MTATTRPKPEFWDDYEPRFPAGSLSQLDTRRVDRNGMVELVARNYGDKITPNQLRYWENERWVPLPRRSGSPPRALYPAWVSPIIARLLWLRINGRNGDDIRADIKYNLEHPRLLLSSIKTDSMNGPEGLSDSLRELAEMYEKHSGRPIGEAEIILRDPDGAFVARTRYDVGKPQSEP